MKTTGSLFLALLFVTGTAFAAELHWTGAVNGQWSNAGNWNPALVPQTGDDLKFDNGTNPNSTNDLPASTTLKSLVFFTFPASAFTVAGSPVQVSSQINGGGQVTFNTLVRAMGNLTILGDPLFAGGFDVNGFTIDIFSNTGTRFTAPVSGSGTIRAMSGFVNFDAANPFTGTVGASNSSSGAVVNGSLASATIVMAAGRLHGTGTTGPVNGSGGISPQPTSFPQAPGILTTGSLSLTTVPEPILVGLYGVDIAGPSAGSGYDQLRVNGTVTLNNYWIEVRSSYVPAAGTVFTIIDNDGVDPVSGTFAYSGVVYSEGSTITGSNGVSFRVSYHGGDGNDVTLTATATPAITLTSSPNPSLTGQTVHLVATVSGSAGTPTGTVTFRSSSTVLGTANVDPTGQAALDTVLAYSAGGATLTATYNGDATYAARASAPYGHSFTKANTATTLAMSPNPVLTGQPLTATVSTTAVPPGAGKPIGYIVITVDGSHWWTVHTGSYPGTSFTFDRPNSLSPGDHTFVATYVDDAPFGYNNSSSSPVVVQVRVATTTSGSAAPVIPGMPVVVNASVAPVAPATGVPSGNVTLMNGSTVLGSAALDGSGNATITAAPLPAGTYNLTLVYGGGGNFAGSSGNVTVIVVDPTVLASGATVLEGKTAHIVHITVGLNAPAPHPVSFRYSTADGTATAGNDYQAASGTITLAPGQTAAAIDVTIFGDMQPEPDEHFVIRFSDVSGAQLATSQITVTIANDDPFFTTISGLEYANVNGTSLHLELLVPTVGNGPFPVVVAVETDDWSQPPVVSGIAAREANRGYAVATVSFRSSSIAKFPAQIEDLRAAVRWLRANAAQFNLDPARFAAWGIGAGGHLAALLGTTSDVLTAAENGNPVFSSRVKAVVDWYGQTDFQHLNDGACVDHNAADSPESRLLGCAPASCGAQAAAASPLAHVTPDDAEFLVMHGTADCIVPPTQSQSLHDALRAAGVPATLRLIAAGHGGAAWATAETLRAVDEFLDATLKTAAPARRRSVTH